MNAWTALGIFLLGSGAGALTTAVYYSAKLDALKALVQRPAQYKDRDENAENEKRKSA